MTGRSGHQVRNPTRPGVGPGRRNGHHVLMTSMPRRLLMLVVALSFVGAVGACGGSSPSTTAPTSSTTSAPTSAAEPTGGSADQFCTVVREQKALLVGTQLPALMTSGTPDAWKAYLDQTAAANQQLVDTAPPEVK